MKKIGLTGTIGSGKSYVIEVLKEYGIPCLDLDIVAKEVRNHIAKQDIIDYFGDQILSNDEIDTKKLGKVIFSNEEKRKKLESLIHPHVLKKMQDFFTSSINCDYAVVEQALLYELGWERYYDEVWLVDAPSAIAVQRLINYRGYSKQQALQIMATQKSNSLKHKRVDYVIINDDDKNKIQKQIEMIINKG